MATYTCDYKKYVADLSALGDTIEEPLSLFSGAARCYILWRLLEKEGEAQNKDKAIFFKNLYDMYVETTRRVYYARDAKPDLESI